jgi:hypothetical protein
MTDDILARLAAPFPPEKIEWRVGATMKDKSRGLALAYIDARTVQDRLDEVCGVNWQTRHHHCGGEKLGCDIGIKIGDEWIWRGDGAGPTDVEGDKGAFSDAFKRAAVRWGVGRYLYDLDSPWVNLERRGDSYVIAKSELPGLARLLGGHPMRDPKTRPPAGTETPMPQGAMIEPVAAKAPAEPASKPYQPRRAMGGPAPSLLQRATAEADKSSFDYEHFWTAILSSEERKEIGAEVHKQLKALAELADKRAALAS